MNLRKPQRDAKGNARSGRFLDRHTSGVLAIRPQALSLYWLFGLGAENEVHANVTIVTIEGPLEQRSFCFDGYDAILERFREACKDEATNTILLRLDSPGGDAAGCFEAARMMRELAATSGKRVVAFADEHAYSAAYAMACVADEIYLPPSGGVGSVGVIAACMSEARFLEKIGLDVAVVYAGARKADCHPALPLSEEAVAGVQADVDRLAGMFRDLVAGARMVKPDAIESLEADCFMGEDAIAAGLADGVMGFDELLVMLAEDGARERADEDTGADASTNRKGTTMLKGAKAKAKTIEANKGQKADEVEAVDLLAKPQVGIASPAALAGVAAALAGPNAPAATAAPAASKEEKAEGDGGEEGEEEEEEASTSTTTTTTTTTEEEEAGEGEGEEEEEEEEEAAAVAPITTIAARTSGDVLKAVREITGETSPAAQVGALVAIAEKAGRSDKAAKEAKVAKAAKEKTEKASIVDKAIRLGKLPKSQRAWAMSQPMASITAYLKNAEPLVSTTKTALREKAEKAAPGATSDAPIDEAIANVARTMQMDPKAIAAHAAELRTRGLIH